MAAKVFTRATKAMRRAAAAAGTRTRAGAGTGAGTGAVGANAQLAEPLRQTAALLPEQGYRLGGGDQHGAEQEEEEDDDDEDLDALIC